MALSVKQASILAGVAAASSLVTYFVVKSSSKCPNCSASSSSKWDGGSGDVEQDFADMKLNFLKELYRDLRRLYERVDTDKSGDVTRAELAKALGDDTLGIVERLSQYGVSQAEAYEHFKPATSGAADEAGISLYEFLKHFGSTGDHLALLHVFNQTDENGDGVLTSAELQSQIARFNVDLSTAALTHGLSLDASLFKRLDADGNKEITLQEFLEAFDKAKADSIRAGILDSVSKLDKVPKAE